MLKGVSRLLAEPERLPVLDLVALAVDFAEVAPDEDGTFPRREVTRLLFKLYGHGHKRSDFHRWAWRQLLGAFAAPRAAGERRYYWDRQEEARIQAEKDGSKRGKRR